MADLKAGPDELVEGADAAPAPGPKGWNSREYGAGFFAKLVMMALVNALGVYVLLAAWRAQSWWVLGAMLVILLALDYVYFSKRHTIPAKYIAPGVVFLVVFQIFVIFYTAYIALTNYGDGHNLDKGQAVAAILSQNEKRVTGSAAYPLTVLTRGDEFGFAIISEGKVLVGTEDEPLTEAAGATVAGTRITAVPGFGVASQQEIFANQQAITNLRVPFSRNAEEGSIRTQNGTVGYLYKSTFTYDAAADTMTDATTGTVYTATSHGQFAAPDGTVLPTGWRVLVGFENFTTAFTNDQYAGPFLRVLVWNLVFAVVSVLSTFLLGLVLAIVLNDERVRGRKIYRTLLLLPYAFPGFLSALIWSGLLNEKFGFINQVILGGVNIGWLTDPWLARLSVLGVNLWLGFPYMFLIATGALQSLPGDVKEAARVDGAGPLRMWWSVTGPLVLISTAPLLIASFAFNFNNFTLIYMLTQGGPRFGDTSAPIGATDLLITMVYSISGVDGSAAKNYGLASALSIVIFVVVAVIAGLGFRQTRKLEEVI
ncbi:MAG: ABC transporter permease subunit [Propionicimonas sp.]|uniref:ABC transporter permease subunit n=1 Tax=Propionicimonas sp. TaxID=1955623 RepID=UPI003D1472DA